MGDDVGKTDPPTGDAVFEDDAPLLEDGVLALVSARGALDALAWPSAGTPDGGAVAAYIGGQLAPRSKETALDSLRRLSRLVLGRPVDPAQIPWPKIGYDLATRIRARLYEMTREGAITPGTANLTLSHLRGLMKTMRGKDLITSNQWELVSLGHLKNVPGSRVPRGRALTPREEQTLRKTAQALDGYRGAMLDTAIVLATGAGLRREEIATLTLGGVGSTELQILGKGNKERRLPIDEQMRDAVDAWLEERTRQAPTHSGFFCSPQNPNKELSAWGFWSLVRTTSHVAFGGGGACGDECHCLKVVTGPHDFRRTFATRMLDRGFDIRQVQQLMGHDSPETTARYDKRSLDELFAKRLATRIIA